MKRISVIQLRKVFYLAIFLFSTNTYAQYCIPAPAFGCILGEYPSAFSMTGSPTSINNPSLTCPSGSYEDRTAETCAVASPSLPACSITSNVSSSTGYSTTSYGSVTPTSTNISCQIWVDWNNDLSFDAGETIGGDPMLYNTATPLTITIPSGMANGYYRMRLMLSSAAGYPSMDPCMELIPGFPGFTYFTGVTIDYTLEIVAGCPAPAVTLGAATCSTQVINWTAAAGATGYEYLVNNTAGSPTGAGTATTALTATATGLAAGTAYYSHVRTNCGAGVFSPWVNTAFTTPGPGPIVGNAALCPSSTSQYSNAVAGGTWASSAPSVATISATGLLSAGTGTGNTVVSYTVAGCTTTLAVTVGTMPAITGTTNVCPGSTTTLSNAVPGGTWSSSNPTVASIVGATRVVTGGASAGTAVITYTASGCSATVTITVSTLPAISGGSTVCVGQTMPLSNSTPGGVWTSSASGTASVAASGVVTGGAVGNATITYTLGTCFVTKTVTVGAAIAAITGTTTFCVTGGTSLSCTTAGGTWSSSNTGVASVTGGAVDGIAAGTATISYSVGSCSSTALVTVEPSSVTIAGVDTVCKGPSHSVTLTPSIPGGSWSSSAPTKGTVDPATGVVTGLTVSSSFTITYTVTNSCGTLTATKNMRVRSGASNPCATGIDPNTGAEGVTLKVFPNPNSGAFTVNLESGINEAVHVQVSNVLGQKVKEFTTVTNSMTDVNLGSVPGIYLLTASTDHGKYSVKVVVGK